MEWLFCLMMFLLIAIDSKMNQGRLIPISIIFMAVVVVVIIITII